MSASSSAAAQPQREAEAGNEVVVITGASSGLGLETAKQLARRGAEVVMICRDQARGERALAQVAEAATGKPPVLMLADLSSQADVRRVAREVEERYDHIDVLINNAGGASAGRELTVDGIERTWATNHLAPFLLTELLLGLVTASKAGRVVTVASELYSKKLDLADLQGERKYSYFGAYRLSKLGNVMFTSELARRLEGSRATAVSVSPGPARTNFGGGGPSGAMGVLTSVMKHTPIFKPADEAAQGIVWAATASEPRSTPGALYMRRKQLPLKGAAGDPELAARLWQISAEQVGGDAAHRPGANGASTNQANG